MLEQLPEQSSQPQFWQDTQELLQAMYALHLVLCMSLLSVYNSSCMSPTGTPNLLEAELSEPLALLLHADTFLWQNYCLHCDDLCCIKCSGS